ncbi:MAG: hypothetical protein KF752_09370 [Pirellulaceae bacterium]|nr:hypothetical protein [Pirellulaceae bacterium]
MKRIARLAGDRRAESTKETQEKAKSRPSGERLSSEAKPANRMMAADVGFLLESTRRSRAQDSDGSM